MVLVVYLGHDIFSSGIIYSSLDFSPNQFLGRDHVLSSQIGRNTSEKKAVHLKS